MRGMMKRALLFSLYRDHSSNNRAEWVPRPLALALVKPVGTLIFLLLCLGGVYVVNLLAFGGAY